MDWLKNLYQQYLQSDIPAATLLRGDTNEFLPSVNRNLNQNLSLLSTPEGAMDLVNPMAKVGGLLGTFIGKGSKLWNPTSYAKALEMEKTGAKAEDIWKETGNAKFADNQWRQEISDNESKTLLTSKAKPTMLNKKLVHNDLFKAYPELNDVSLGLKPTQQSQSSYFDKAKNRIQIGKYSNPEQPPRKELLAQTKAMLNNINQKIEDLAKDTTMDKAKKYLTYKQYLRDFEAIKNNYKKDRDLVTGIPYTQFEPNVSSVLHETQHSIQRLEDWAKGGNVKSASGVEAYKRLAGEAEARLTQRRIPLTDAERRANFPYEYGTDYGLDVPFNELIVQGLLSK
jgi:hypothetical protein